MSYLVRPRIWNRQPEYLVGPDRDNPINVGLLSLINGRYPTLELVNKIFGTEGTVFGNIGARSGSSAGWGIDAAVSQDQGPEWNDSKYAALYEPTAPPITLISLQGLTTGNNGRAIGRPNGSGGAAWSVGAWFGSAAGGYAFARFGDGTLTLDFTPPAFVFEPRQPTLTIFTINSSTSTLYAGYPGSSILDERSQSTPAGNFYYEASGGAGGRSFAVHPYPGSPTNNVVLAGHWKRCLAREEVLSLFANPFQLFQPQVRRVYDVIPTTVVLADMPRTTPLLMSIGQIGKRALPRSNFLPSPAPYVPPIPPNLSPLLIKLERSPIGRAQRIGMMLPSGFTPITLLPAAASHNYVARVPQVQARVMPTQVTHTYTAQVPQVQARVMPARVLHTYTAQVPQVQARVMPARALHTYTAQVPALLVGPHVAPPSALHTYTAQVPQVQARVMPARVLHTYTAQVGKFVGSLKPSAATHTYTGKAPVLLTTGPIIPGPATHIYTGRAPQVQARVAPGRALHSYTVQLPKLQTRVMPPRALHIYSGVVPIVQAPIYGWGGRERIGSRAAQDYFKRIGAQTVFISKGRIGSNDA